MNSVLTFINYIRLSGDTLAKLVTLKYLKGLGISAAQQAYRYLLFEENRDDYNDYI